MYTYKTGVPQGSWGERGRDLVKVREAFRRCFGDFEEKRRREPDLDVIVLDKIDLGGGLVQEKIRYQTEPGEYVPAWLLRPARPIGPLAAIIAFHGHGGKYHVGKEGVVGTGAEFADIGMGFAVQFARAGYVVLAPDSVCFGERRNPYPDRWPDGFWERVVAMRETAAGGCMARKNVWDNMRAIDFVQTLPYVDPERIGGCGLSMGSGMTFYTMMWEPRLKVGVAVCSMYTLKVLYEQPLMHCYMNYVPRMVETGLEMYDVFPLIAPRALLMVNPTDSREDPLAETRELYEKSRWAWEEAGRAQAFQLEVFEGQHEFPAPMRLKALDWFRRWL